MGSANSALDNAGTGLIILCPMIHVITKYIVCVVVSVYFSSITNKIHYYMYTYHYISSKDPCIIYVD